MVLSALSITMSRTQSVIKTQIPAAIQYVLDIGRIVESLEEESQVFQSRLPWQLY